MHQQAQPQPVTDQRPDVPPGLAAVLGKMMAKRPENRFQTPAAVAEALAPFALAPFDKGDTAPVIGSTTVPPPLRQSPKRRMSRRWWMPVVGMAAALVLVLATILVIRSKQGSVAVQPDSKFKSAEGDATKRGGGKEDKDAAAKSERDEKKAAQGELSPAVQALVQTLGDKDARVRREAARTLRKLGDKSAVPALMQRIADDSWGQIHGPFVTMANDTPYEDVASGSNQGSKYAALEALRELGPERVPEALQQATKSKNAEVRAWALRAMTEQQKNSGSDKKAPQ
jgi:hypothetical protein